MKINTAVYGEGTAITGFPNTMKFSDSFRALAEASKIVPDAYPNESIYQNYCLDDPLCVSRWIRVKFTHDNRLSFQQEFFRPRVANYFPCYGLEGGAPYQSFGLATNYTYEAYGKRIGMNSTIAAVPAVRACTEMATEYLVMAVYCTVVTYTTRTVYPDSDIAFFQDIVREVDMEYDMALEMAQNEGFWDNHYISRMWVRVCYGTQTNRDYDSYYLGIGVSRYPKVPETSLFAYGDGDIYEGDYNKQELLMPASDVGTYSNAYTLMQGGTWNGEVRSDKDVILYLSKANTIWSLAIYDDIAHNDVNITTYIDNELYFRSAYALYRSTGFKFCGNLDDAMHSDCDDTDIFSRGKPTENGGIDPNDTADDDDFNNGLVSEPSDYGDNGYNGNESVVDMNNYVDETPLPEPTLSVVGAFNRSYAISYTSIKNLANWLWNADEDIFDEIVKGLALHGENPIDGIISVRLYPFPVNSLVTVGSSEIIKVGRNASPIEGFPITYNSKAIVDLGKCYFYPHFKNFLDYKPYTEARLYIPYIGVVPVDTIEFMGHEISVKMIVDIVTGACCAMVYKDGIICTYASGIIGVDIPFSGTDSANFASRMLSSTVGNMASGLMGVAGAGKSAGSQFNAAAEGLEGFAKATLANYTVATEYKAGGASTPNCGNWQPQYCYFIIDRPIDIAPPNYGHFAGFACAETGRLDSFHGFTVCSNVDTSGFAQATEGERDELKKLLESGVFL